MRRLIVALGQRVEKDSMPLPLYVFPPAERFQEATDDTLRATGLTASKVETLRRVAERLMSGTLEAKELEEVSSRDAMAALCRIKGIGPWTAAIIVLRGMSRLDVFPANDSGVTSNIIRMAGPAFQDLHLVLDALGPQRGMLYFYLLLARRSAEKSCAIPAPESLIRCTVSGRRSQ